MKVRFKVQNCNWEESRSREPTTLKIGYLFGYRLSRVCVCVFFFFFLKHVLWLWCFSNRSRALFIEPTNLFFSKTFIQNGSHGTIHTFKNYFVTVFSDFSFQQNNRYLNTLQVWGAIRLEAHGPRFKLLFNIYKDKTFMGILFFIF